MSELVNLKFGHTIFLKFLSLALILSETKFNQLGSLPPPHPKPQRAMGRFQAGYEILGYEVCLVPSCLGCIMRLPIPAWSPFTVHSNSYALLIQATHYSDLAFSQLLLSPFRKHWLEFLLFPLLSEIRVRIEQGVGLLLRKYQCLSFLSFSPSLPPFFLPTLSHT